MDPDLRSLVLEALLAKKDELESLLQQSMSHWRDQGSGTWGENPADEVDGALCETSTHNHYCFVERKYREYQKVDGLIRRMQSDEEFGLCEECGEAIPVERLIILPDATYCVPCQQRMERINGLKLSGSWRPSQATERTPRDWENPDDEETALLDAHMESLMPLDPEELRT